MERSNITFENFLYGGAVNEGGKSPSIVDPRHIPEGHSDWE